MQQLSSTCAFVCPTDSTWRTTTTTQLSAKKKKKSRSSAGEGFGKTAAVSESSSKISGATINEEDDSNIPRVLQSIDSAEPTSVSGGDLDIDPNLSDEARSKAILRQKFGLKSFEEQQADLGDYRAIQEAEAKAAQREKLRNIEKLWPEDKDFFAMLPPSVVRGVDTFLKTGLGLSTVAFITAGILITIEAGSKATGYEMPAGLEEFVVNIVEPNFTPGLGVLLLFSIFLGVFTISLGGTSASSYRERP